MLANRHRGLGISLTFVARTRLHRATTAAAAAVLVLGGAAACSPNEGGVEPIRNLADMPGEAARVIDEPAYAHARWSISALDLSTGETLIDIDGEKMAEPASFTKTYTMGAAWLRWGPDHVVETPVKAQGDVIDGVLDGDLVLVGMGDLTLGGRTRADGTVDFENFDHNDANAIPGATLTAEDPLAGLNDLAAQVKASGIDRVTGDIVVDDRLFHGELEGQPISPIIVNQNLIDVLVTPGGAGEPAQVEMRPEVAPWQVTSTVQTVAAGEKTSSGVSNPRIVSNGEISIDGSIAAGSDPVLKVVAFDDPATFARTAFIEALHRAGVATSAPPTRINATSGLAAPDAVAALPTVAALESLPLAEQATYVLKVSYNRGAQTTVCLFAVEAGSDDCADGLAEMGRTLADAGLDTTGISLIDGSGLAGNLVTAENSVELQRIMFARPDAEAWMRTLPVLGVDGSLAEVQVGSPAAGLVHAKTGTLVGGDQLNGRFRLETKALGGAMRTASGRDVAFMIMLNNGFTADIDGVLQANDDVGAVAAAIQQAY